MLPSPGALLRGLRSSLATSVLPALPKGDAARQLRAALHLLGRLERVWDLYPRHTSADNADVEAVLRAVFERLEALYGGEAVGGLVAALVTAGEDGADPTGVNDPDLRRQVRRNAGLHRILVDLDTRLSGPCDIDPGTIRACREDLSRLYRRMAIRDSELVGDQSIEEEAG